MRARQLVEGCSLDMVGRHLDALPSAAALLRPGTRINIAAAPGESPELRRATAAAIAAHQLTPVPQVAARRITSAQTLKSFLSGLQADGTSGHLLTLGGDPDPAEGPYAQALAVIRSVRLADYDAVTVGVAGHPEGHPAVRSDVLWDALRAKTAELAAQGLSAEIFTQLTLDVDAVVSWIEVVRREGIAVPIRVGLSGPVEPARLLAYARRVGAASGTEVAERYGLSPDDPPQPVGPARFIDELARRLDPRDHGDVRVHLYSLGGLRETAEWIHDALR
ncbi:methylenetetrahydrofolate reductase [Rathayibacter soli]|uniref:methylenetetrahydrofolate reductase n=1 Tax=Rathayibacter soli TaxID=3144168 RepID=UPI0027E51F4E|nr:methylenetetrahydrofolate reductase [Glaciibacter superstes]